jgi:hypothetical protein
VRKQCEKCPWKKSTDPFDIPHGYDPEKHAALRDTIARDVRIGGELRVMACHESAVGAEEPCVGWLVNQLGPGNNIGLRLACAAGLVDHNVETVGEQHERFEDTLPPRGARRVSPDRSSPVGAIHPRVAVVVAAQESAAEAEARVRR